MKKLLPLLLFILPSLMFGQIDTEFWFAPPDLTQGTGVEPRRDSTVYFVVSTLNSPADIRINQPANPGFEPVVINLAANSTQAINLGLRLSQLESKPANAVLNTGVLIRSTAPITAYYEVRSNANREIFSLKGKNALGTTFYTPFEDSFGNSESFNNLPYLPLPRAGFIVVAAFDSTTVSITPQLDVLGHPGNETFEVFLMRGETYYVEAIDGDLTNKPYGTKIESDKPIAVTLKDDMITQDLSTTAGADIAADQMFAYDFAGGQHIIVRGTLQSDPDRVVVLSTVDGTEITVSGNPVAGVFDEGEQYVFTLNDPSAFIETTEKVYVFHVTGQSDQLCGALIPPLECTGSTQIGFVRPTVGAFFALNLTIRTGAENDFTLNGDPTLIPGDAFSPVPGSNGEFVFARIQYSNAQIPLGSANLIENSGDELFHLGVLTATSGNSANYGYFSSFSYLNIGDLSEVCLNDSVVLDAGPGKTGYMWNTGEATQTITVSSPGTYFVDAFSGTQCVASDTIVVSYYEPPVTLGGNDTICDGTTLDLNINGNYLFEWQDGSTGSGIEVSEAGWVWVEVTDFQECTLRDSAFISVSPRPETPELVGEDTYCEGTDLDLSLSSTDGALYRIVLPDSTATFNQNLVIEDLTQEDAGLYLGFISVEGCESFNDSVEVQVIPSPDFTLPADEIFCADETFEITTGLDPGGLDFSWQDNSDAPSFTASETGNFYVDVTNEFDCLSTDSIFLTFNPLPENPAVTGNEITCEGEEFAVSTADQQDVVFTWTDPQGVIVSNESSLVISDVSTAFSGVYSVQAELNNCFSEVIGFTVDISENPVVILPNDTVICEGEEIVITAPEDFASYTWSTGDEGAMIIAGDGTYELTVTNEGGCVSSDLITVTESGPEAVFNFTPTDVVQPETVISFNDQSNPGQAAIVSREWDFGDGRTSLSVNPDHDYQESGVYTVTLTTTDANGCTSTAEAVITVAFDLRIPEGFSPNGDGVNDLFVIQGIEAFPGTSLQVFNRWGGVVFENTRYNNDFDGDGLPVGTYFYILKLPGGEDFTGPITIAR